MTAHWAATPTAVYPLHDLRVHDVDSCDCWCKPFFDCNILVHNSADGREAFERGERKVS